MKRLNRYERVALGQMLDLSFAKVVVKNPVVFGKQWRIPSDPNPLPRLRLWSWWP